MKLGIDLGGSHIAVGLITDENKIIYKTEQDLKDEDISELIISLIKEVLRDNDIKAEEVEKIGVCIPGTISNGVIVKAGNLRLRQYNILEKLKKEFSNIPIQIRNDAKCAAIAEKKTR